MTSKARLRFVWGILVAAAAGAVAVDVGSFALPAHGAKDAAKPAATAVCPASHEADPYAAAALFVRSAVQRTNLAASYHLASASLRGGVSCAEWAGGNVPVGRVADVDWKRSGYQVVTERAREVVLRILLHRKSGGTAAFTIDMQKQGADWKVGRFEPVPPAA